MTPGPDGNEWFVDWRPPERLPAPEAGNYGYVTPNGSLVERPLGTPAGWPFAPYVGVGSYPVAMTAGPDGNIWIAEQLSGDLARVNLHLPPPPRPRVALIRRVPVKRRIATVTLTCEARPGLFCQGNLVLRDLHRDALGASVPFTIEGGALRELAVKLNSVAARSVTRRGITATATLTLRSPRKHAGRTVRSRVLLVR
ncbi:MAG: hypothetical protein M3Z27_04850 [Actinomycetota bacterium]|nr:hypothetical protein [Actinomycetota bacterium]